MKVSDIVDSNLPSKTSGIYAIICTANNKCYIGKSKNIHIRWTSHKEKLRKHVHHNKHLQNTWNKYGQHSFKYIVLETCQIEVLGQKELEWVLKFNVDDLFNSGNVGGGFNVTERTRKALSEAQKRKWCDPLWRVKMSNALKGRKMPKGFGIGRKGVKHSPESIEKIVRNKIGKPLSLKNKFNLLCSRKRKLTNKDADHIRRTFLEEHTPMTMLAEKYSVSIHIIFNILRGRSYVLDCESALIQKCIDINKGKRLHHAHRQKNMKEK
jgi:group I intron endonuclease